MSTHPRLHITGLRVRGVNVPMRRPLATRGGTVGTAPLALIDLHTDQGVTGSTYLFCYTPLVLQPVLQMLANLEPLLRGQAVAPLDLDRQLQRQFRLLGAKGPVAMALAGVDMAAWDALARAHALPLVRLLGGTPRPVPAYNSNGLGIIGAERAAAEARELVAPGFAAIKLRLGYDDAATDLAVVRAVRGAVGDGITLMSDYNQGLSVAEAVHRLDVLAGEGLAWIEEPTLADDHAGHAEIRRRTRLRIQMGENWWGPHDMARCVAAGGSDLGMPDAMKIGGVTGWQRAAAIADAAGMPISSHLFPEVSAHLLAASPTCHWLEYVDWAEPVLREPLKIENGHALPGEAPGSGVAWDEAAVERYRLA
ncbi:enolase C-terminal domain-like protein [uncultured Piscinibacter sp.]|uniref:enolase C-terminal domain-like protein n=1 Tax=uncultured Piscinibacter sp. TaxID=1131835 RepID=UPI00261D0BFD|nr:enolase C-terminal domain-like protein [uncultured Piscinibacter sp.]